MNSKKELLLKIAGLCGVLVPIIAFVFISITIYFTPWFIWQDNWLSELAGRAGEKPIWAARGIISLLFNIGVVIAGITGIVCAITARKIKILNTDLGKIGTLFLLFDMLALCAIGIFPITTGFLHDVVSITFFILVPLSLIFIGTAFRRNSEKRIGWFFTIFGLFSICAFPFFIIPQPIGSNAIIEMIPITSISACAILFGFNLIKGDFELTTQ